MQQEVERSRALGDLLDSPLGRMIALVDGRGALLRLDFLPDEQQSPTLWQGFAWQRDAAAVAPIARQLDEYFAGRRRVFDLALVPRGTPYQQEVWGHLRQVPYGVTLTYVELGARLLPHRTSARAIGRANALNPISIIVPCHRIIGADGSLTGYAGGLARKQALLELEGVPTAGCQQLLL
ncbi:methylated-DNA--[protein]-cysteine S-methyltransferase [Pseudomonas sp. R-28-1W-6]|uniref:methylated-DNA--[protein]-cysteine S-methyltransferase n=1 Tax=Pseudomonas sp. R-28-1W-6 TaxID=2650101 RepID=UPI001365F0F7|nr:methylated-DNA--[protein]-cysteine S-methyltransferase [Pseudomonas sp. R-28-1W-6]MWV13388.1 methylated-DNA--[protein]-cysteine S-methyltransferase [Pseudomonas sp. R-28-1W-6]